MLIVVKRYSIDKYAARFSKWQHTSGLNIIIRANVMYNCNTNFPASSSQHSLQTEAPAPFPECLHS
ncbi:hypothetical protein C7475_102943 [Chitinophaga sp. S165]|nr:hypothetical protein C7475_102943 [Chitinophaga sp. S165]